MTKELYEEIEDALKDRSDWESRQETWYQMRQRGIRRRSKPYPGAPDQHYPLADTMIEKLKPLYIGQLYANEQLAAFVATCQQDASYTTAASEWFDYQLKQQSNFEQEIFAAIDGMLQNGFAVVKVYWSNNRICFSAVDPLHVIIPGSTENLQDSDWFVHIIHMSVAQYKKNDLFDQDKELINRIKGKGKDTESGGTAKRQVEEWREGINCGRDNEIVLWECYHRADSSEDAQWMVDTISPVAGWDCSVRGTYGLPFNHGQLPFFKIQCEITEKGWYAPRGAVEKAAPFETSLCRLWNGLLQHLDFHGTPTYKQTGQNQIPNTANFKNVPGGILPYGIEPVTAPNAPVDFMQLMEYTRSISEYRDGVPDLGASEHLTPGRSKSGDTTATQINAIVGQSGQSNDLRARVFRLDLAVGYKMAWLILNQYKKDELDYLKNGLVQQVPQEAIHEKYIIQPNGSPDSWNKQSQISRRLAIYNLLIQNPFISRDELTKWLLEVEDPRIIKRLYVDPGDELKEQAEEQAQEISIMLLGYPAEVNESDDDKAHLQSMTQFFERRLGTGEPISPELARLALMHGAAHDQALAQKKDPALMQIRQAVMPIIKVLEAIANQPDQTMQSSNIVQMQPQGGMGTSATGTSEAGGPASAPSQNGAAEPAVDTAVKVGNMLVNMVKAGIPVTHAEINKVMQEAGLAPLSLNPITTGQLNGTDGMPVDGGEMPAERPSNGMIAPPVENAPPVNIINIASRKTITMRRNADGVLVGEIVEYPNKKLTSYEQK